MSSQEPERDKSSDTASVERRTVTGLVWLGGGRASAQMVYILSRIVLARVLLPEQFGIVGMAMSVMVFIDLLVGIGIAPALIKSEVFDDLEWSSAFWWTVVQGTILAGVAVSLAPFVADFFDTPELTSVLRVLVIGSIIRGPFSVLQAEFTRRMNFRVVALRIAVSNTIGGATSVALALSGFGVWSLVLGRVATNITQFVLVLTVARWRPSFTFSYRAVKGVVRFGSSLAAAGVLNAINLQIPVVVIGRFLGAEPLGYFSLAQQVVLAPLQNIARPVSFVLYPALAMLQSKPAELRETFLKWQSGVFALAAVIPALMAVLAADAVPVILGDQWSDAVPLFQIVAIPAVMRLGMSVWNAALRALGASGAIVTRTAIVTVLRTIGLCAGLPWGLVGAMVGWAVAEVLTFVLASAMIGRNLELPLSRQLRMLGPVALALSGLVAGALLGIWGLGDAHRWARLLLSAFAGVLAYAVVLRFAAPEQWQWLGSLTAHLRRRFSRRRRAKSSQTN